jgi:hypothetical protein
MGKKQLLPVSNLPVSNLPVNLVATLVNLKRE